MSHNPDHPRTALVTGAGHRIGRAIALSLAEKNWQVAIHYHHSAQAATELVDLILAGNGKACALGADLGEMVAIPRLIEEAHSRLGPLTCLVNNASLFLHDDVKNVTMESWTAHLDVNFRAPLFLSQSFANALEAPETGNIINLIDQRVWKLTPEFLSYTLSKSGLWTLTKTLAQALAPRIRVNAIGPGPTLPSQHQSAENFARQIHAVPLGIGPTLEEIAHAVHFLLESPSITGQMIALDGGQHLSWNTADTRHDGNGEGQD